MDFIKFSIGKPVTVIVGVIFILMFGFVSFIGLPYQLSPNVETPTVTVNTVWTGASPYEIERDIIEEQEKVLKGLPNLDIMTSTSSNNSGTVSLRFKVGTDIEEALLHVSNKLDEVRTYPENVDKPILNAAGAEASPVIYCVLRPLEGNDRHIYTYRAFFEDEIRQFLERVEGVADVVIYGGVEPEMQVILKPEKLAAYGVTISQVVAALRDENINLSAGNLGVGRREYRIRTVSEYKSAEDIANVIVLSDGQRRVRISDLAEVRFAYSKATTPGLQDGQPGITIATRPEPNANILDMTDAMEVAVAEINATRLKQEGLEIEWVYDQRPYIRGSINLLRQNILIGAALAIIVLVIFMRSFTSVIVVATAIPISIVGSFIFMRAMGTSLNVISLAGIAFAVGMLVDNAIVVLENVDRHRRMGKTPFDSAYDGAREVWGAVLASSLTTVAVFLPIIFLEQEAGLLFRDIAIAVTASVSISLIVSVSVIPMFSRYLFENKLINRLEGKAAVEGTPTRLGTILSDGFMSVIGLALRNAVTRSLTILVLSAGAVTCAFALMPKMEYLPQGNRDLIFNIMFPPPGLSYEERYDIGMKLYEFIKPYYGPDTEDHPGVRRVFFAGPQGFLMMGIISNNQARTRELLPISRKMIASVPGLFGISNQASIFNRGIGRGRTIDVDLSGADLTELVNVAGVMMDVIREKIPEAQIRPVPSLDIMFPEAHFIPDNEKLRAVGMSSRDFAIALDVLMNGRAIGEFKREGEKKIDLIVKVADSSIANPEDILHITIPTPGGRAVPIGALARMVETTGITSIRHLERNRTISLQVSPPYSVTIQEAMEILEEDVVSELAAQGLMDNINFGLSGTADKLTQTRIALQWNFALAILITYLLMSALFGNFIYPLVIMFTVPLASAGGLIGLKLVNIFIEPQQMDILTMLGFIILIGVVVNNAILIVHQSLNNIRFQGMAHRDAVLEATRSRLRPIYMTAATSIFGMLPLVVWPGPGSELYRGLGSVVLGGLAISTIFTVFLIPSLLLFFIKMESIPSVFANDIPDEDAKSRPEAILVK